MKYFISRSLCSFLFLSQSTIAQVASAKSSNIIFILTDDLGYGDVGVFFQNKHQPENDRSKPFVLTPNLNEMAKAGAILPQQYINQDRANSNKF